MTWSLRPFLSVLTEVAGPGKMKYSMLSHIFFCTAAGASCHDAVCPHSLRLCVPFARLAAVKSLLVNIGVILLAACNAFGQTRISVAGAAKAKVAIRIMQNAAEAELIGGEFDPLTAGLLNGLQKNLEEDMETGPAGDRRLARMLHTNLGWLIECRIDRHPEPLRTEIMQWHLDCAHEINVALRRSAVPKYGGACEFTDVKFRKLHPD